MPAYAGGRVSLLLTLIWASAALSLGVEEAKPAKPPQNLFGNPSFELGPDQWNLGLSGTTAATFTVDRADAADGRQSALLSIGAIDGWGVQFGQTMSAPAPGKTYTYAVLAKSTKGPVSMNIEIERPAPAWDRVARAPAVTVNKDQWKELHVTFKVEKPFPEGWSAFVSCSQPNVEFRLDMFRLYEGEYVPFQPAAKSAEAAPSPGEPLVLDLGGGAKMDLVLIQPGSFLMGDDNGKENEKPAHKVTISRPFYIGKYPVTQEQWEAVMGNKPSNFKGAQRPVERVSWEDCQAFLQKLGEKLGGDGQKFSLPTEAQWEYACRAGSTSKYCFGSAEERLGDYAWFDGNAAVKTHPVGEKRPNAWGLHDMHGNVWEWCADWYDVGYYAQSPAVDPTGPSSGANRVLRGGSWAARPFSCRAAYRSSLIPTFRHYDFGFRVVCGTQ